MPRSLKVLLPFLALLIAWSAANTFVQPRLQTLVATDEEAGSAERALFSAHIAFGRWHIFAVAPVLLAPLGAVVAWLIRTRGKSRPGLRTSETRSYLRTWFLVLAGSALLGVGAATVRALSDSWSWSGLASAALLSYSWSYAAALYHALWLQKSCNEYGSSRFKASTMAVLAFLILCVTPLYPLGVAFPLWVYWASRRDLDVGHSDA